MEPRRCCGTGSTPSCSSRPATCSASARPRAARAPPPPPPPPGAPRGGLPRISSMTAACNAPLIHRLKRRSRDDAEPALAELIEEVAAYLPAEPPTSPATEPVVSLRLQTSVGEVKLFTV